MCLLWLVKDLRPIRPSRQRARLRQRFRRGFLALRSLQVLLLALDVLKEVKGKGKDNISLDGLLCESDDLLGLKVGANLRLLDGIAIAGRGGTVFIFCSDSGRGGTVFVFGLGSRIGLGLRGTPGMTGIRGGGTRHTSCFFGAISDSVGGAS